METSKIRQLILIIHNVNFRHCEVNAILLARDGENSSGIPSSRVNFYSTIYLQSPTPLKLYANVSSTSWKSELIKNIHFLHWGGGLTFTVCIVNVNFAYERISN